jgi:hypothetical protein
MDAAWGAMGVHLRIRVVVVRRSRERRSFYFSEEGIKEVHNTHFNIMGAKHSLAVLEGLLKIVIKRILLCGKIRGASPDKFCLN